MNCGGETRAVDTLGAPGQTSLVQGHTGHRRLERTLAACAVLALVSTVSACLPFGFQRAADVSAPREYRSAMRAHELCAPEVELVPSVAQANRPYREVANLSANCYPGVISECERRLLERACELKAHAIILTEAKAGGASPGGTTDSRVVRSALAVRWTE